jgi:hypothetical protein
MGMGLPYVSPLRKYKTFIFGFPVTPSAFPNFNSIPMLSNTCLCSQMATPG